MDLNEDANTKIFGVSVSGKPVKVIKKLNITPLTFNSNAVGPKPRSFPIPYSYFMGLPDNLTHVPSPLPTFALVMGLLGFEPRSGPPEGPMLAKLHHSPDRALLSGPSGTCTRGLFVANEALWLLSYGPDVFTSHFGYIVD